MPAYFSFDVTEVSDPGTFQEYARQVAPTIERYNGRYLIRGGKSEIVEGAWRPARPVLIEFESVEKARQWYDSDKYQALIKLRSGAAKLNAVLIEGIPR